jgi:predicted DNA-binding ribbon-helix-helix protein
MRHIADDESFVWQFLDCRALRQIKSSEKLAESFDLSSEKVVAMKSRLRPHTVTFGRRKTSISLEDAFWIGLYKIASRKRTTRSILVRQIARKQHAGNLSSAVRVFVLNQLHLQIKAKR